MPEDSPAPEPDRRFAVRQARASDIGDLVRLEAAAFASDRLSRRSLAAFVRSPRADLLVLEAADGPAGYALVLSRAGSQAARLYSLAVDPRLQGHGAGAALLSAAEAAARRRGARRLTLEVRADNAAAICLYEGRGYRFTGERSGYYADGAPARRYARRLAEPAAMPPPRRLSRAA